MNRREYEPLWIRVLIEKFPAFNPGWGMTERIAWFDALKRILTFLLSEINTTEVADFYEDETKLDAAFEERDRTAPAS